MQRQDKIHIALCSHSYFLACVAERIFAKKNWKCEFCNRAGRNLVIYEIVSLREQNHHLKYTKQSPKTVLIEEYLLQNCNRRQNKFAPTHQDCERWAFIPKNASELNILYSQALKSLPFIFRDPGEICWTVRWGFVLPEYYSPRNPNPKTWSFFVFIRIWSNGFLCTGCTAYFPPSLPDVDLMPSKLPLSLNAPQYLSSIPFVNSHTIKSKQNFCLDWREGRRFQSWNLRLNITFSYGQ